MHRLPLLLILLVPALASAAALDADAHGETALHEDDPKVSASLLLDVSEAAPGATLRAGVRLHMDDGWHLYWRNPGEAGLPTEVSIAVDGGQVGPLQQPFPETFLDFNDTIQSFGWGEQVLLFRELTLPKDVSGEAVVSANLSLLACKDLCIPGRLELKTRLPIGAATVPGPEAAGFDATAARVPRPVEGLDGTLRLAEGQILSPKGPWSAELTFACAEGSDCAGWTLAPGAAVVADAPPGFDSSRSTRSGDLSATLEGRLQRDAKGALDLTGVALFRDARGTDHPVEWRASLGTVSDAPAAAMAGAAGAAASVGAPLQSAGQEGAPPSLALMVLLAFVGGAILNLMPCVFPVLALKVFSLLKLAGGGRRQAALHAGAYTLGIEAALLVLALVVLAVRAAGAQVGWGFQFQEPLFVAAITALLLVFALNLFGVFHIGSDASGLVAGVERTQGLGRSVAEGALAVVLATPCSAPFLGSAMGFGLTAPAPVVLMLFAALGLGLAAPFVVLVLVPSGVKWLPKPGAWMDTGKQLLGFALLATAVWLVWVLGQLAGIDGVGRVLAFLVVVGMATWMWGKSQSARRARVWQVLALLVIAIGAIFTLRFAPVSSVQAAGPESRAEGEGVWTPYSDARLQEALAAGRPVFVDFTADWCITCKFNERSVLNQSTVQEAFAAADTLLLKVDFTRRDDAILEMLRAHGRAGVPLYLLYRPGEDGKPQILPELLTESLVLKALGGAPG